jgi:hypothetical protein
MSSAARQLAPPRPRDVVSRYAMARRKEVTGKCPAHDSQPHDADARSVSMPLA